jgi:hypothetical protein
VVRGGGERWREVEGGGEEGGGGRWREAEGGREWREVEGGGDELRDGWREKGYGSGGGGRWRETEGRMEGEGIGEWIVTKLTRTSRKPFRANELLLGGLVPGKTVARALVHGIFVAVRKFVAFIFRTCIDF